ncbi:hypothetical protein MMC18_004706 [Xylographa bjoerkii]|nr:hypothetical protein [Xylographa bjoerkii]
MADPFNNMSLEALLSQSPLGTRHNSSFKCCCGNQRCAYLEHNNAALRGLEKDLQSAAQIGQVSRPDLRPCLYSASILHLAVIGNVERLDSCCASASLNASSLDMSLTFALQALLIRHESNMQDAEQERLQMAANIEKLESEKKQLETTNAQTVEENRDLLDQLENLNNTVTESDAQIEALTATLHSTRQELQKLTILAGRAAQLEAQLSAMEIEQAGLESQLFSSEENNKSAVQRWKIAERTLEHLQDQVDRMEKEAREERERHIEVVGRMERRRVVEKELENAAGRLKGAAAMTLGRTQTGGTSVVSHFVKDILQDNANLQMGIVELREMLMSSNAEVETLREQMLLHHDGEIVDGNATLRAELVKSTPAEPVPEVHVHHHYHAPEVSVHRKAKKKRPVVPAGHFYPSSGSSTPRTPSIRDWRIAPPSSAATILSQTSVSIPQMQRPFPLQRYSLQSDQSGESFAPSSVPSSPQSVFRSSSVFDSIDAALESSRPTSPESSVPDSPIVFAKDNLKASKSSFRNFSTPTPLQLTPHQSLARSMASRNDSLLDVNAANGSLCTGNMSRPRSNDSTIPEGQENDSYEDCESPYLEDDSQAGDTPTFAHPSHPQLRRAASHESLISVSGMDIHTLRERPSQMFMGRGFTPQNLYSRPSPTTPVASSNPLVSPTTATGRPALQRRDRDSSDYNRSLLASHARNDGRQPSFGKLVGGWVWGKKAVTTMASTGDLRAKATTPPNPFQGRSPGVNQSGPVRGFRPPPKAPIQVQPVRVDTGLLQELLEEG